MGTTQGLVIVHKCTSFRIKVLSNLGPFYRLADLTRVCTLRVVLLFCSFIFIFSLSLSLSFSCFWQHWAKRSEKILHAQITGKSMVSIKSKHRLYCEIWFKHTKSTVSLPSATPSFWQHTYTYTPTHTEHAHTHTHTQCTHTHTHTQSMHTHTHTHTHRALMHAHTHTQHAHTQTTLCCCKQVSYTALGF